MKNRLAKFSQEKNKRMEKKVKKIAFLALHLGYGGAERAIISEANFLAEKYDVEIICAYKLYEEPAFKVDERVRVRYLSEKVKPNKEELKEAIKNKRVILIFQEALKSLKILYYRKAAIKKAIKASDADIIISTRYLYHRLLGNHKKAGIITIAQEHNHHNGDMVYVKKMMRSVRKIDYFMPVSKELADFYAELLGKEKCIYIPHSLDYIPEQPSELREPILISVGRLSKEKGFPDLIHVFSLIAREYPHWKLHLVGEGDERNLIESAIRELGLESQVVLHGYQGKQYIYELLKKSSIYIMTSYTEAFGLVLIEAQIFGIPCVAFDSARGALEIIDDQKNGYLISERSAEGMSEKIKQLIDDYDLRCELGKNGRMNALQYSAERIKNQWFEFLDTILE